MGEDQKDSDEISIDFTKIKNFFKNLFADKSLESSNKSSAKSSSKFAEQDSDELNFHIDFSKIKQFFQGIFTKEFSDKHAEETISVDWGKLKGFVFSYQVFLLLLIPIILSIFLRVQPSFLPVTDNWARDSVHNSLRSGIALDIETKYPNLMDSQKSELLNEQFNNFLLKNNKALEEQIKGQSLYFKSRMKDDTGQTYLLAIDPYYYARHIRNILENGHVGDEIKEQRPYNNHQLAPIGKFSETNLHMWFSAYLYKIVKLFSPNINLLTVLFYIPIILSTLAAVPVFFIGRKLGGNIGGLFASILVVVHPAFLNRTMGGFADTDAYNVLVPLLIVWLFLVFLDQGKLSLKSIYSCGIGLIVSIYSFIWTGWWFIFNFILAALIGSFLIAFILRLMQSRSFVNIKKNLKENSSRYLLPIFLILISTLGFIKLWLGNTTWKETFFFTFQIFFVFPQKIIHLKSVALTKLWPNVLTTVAELNPASINTVVATLGGKIIVYLAILGIFLVIFKNRNWRTNLNYAIFLLIWFGGTFFSTTRGMRFMLLVVPPFAILLAVVAGFFYYNVSKLISRNISININLCKVIFVIIFCLFFVVDIPHVSSAPFKQAYNSAKGQVPSMNDAWWDTLTNIKESTNKTAIISSWWDFGHWFKFVADRPVTFDGASQNQPQAYWIGKFFLTSNEKEAVGILRMLDCDGNMAFDKLYNYTNNDFLSSVDILNSAFVLDRPEAIRYYSMFLTPSQVNSVIESSHCLNPPEAVVIASEDMVQKSGVWAHFGGWNFEKAAMVNKANRGEDEFFNFARTKLNMQDETEIKQKYDMIKSLGIGKAANDWISPWPSYASAKQAPCMAQEDHIICANGLFLNLTTYKAEVLSQGGSGIPNSLVYINKEGEIIEKEFQKSKLSNSLSFILIPEGDGNYQSQISMPALASSMFSRLFYFEAHGLRYFKKMTDTSSVFGQRIIAYKIDWEGKEKNIVERFMPVYSPGNKNESSVSD